MRSMKIVGVKFVALLAVGVVVGLTSGTALPRPAQAQPYPNYPWCGSMGGGGGLDGYDGGQNCGFTSYDQCMQSVWPGGMCRNNPFYQAPAAAPSRPRKHRSKT